MFLYAGAAILVGAEPFAEGLIETGTQFGIDEFQLVQWVAPFASEFPEFLVAALLAWRLRADAALGALVSSKVNQWTLLIGCLPIAYAISSGSIDPLPTDSRQTEEVLLTAAQSLLAVILLVNLRMSAREAGVILFTLMYFVAAGIFLVRQAVEMRPHLRSPRPLAPERHETPS
jgi:cation:H+ antiporter